jgi:hypothetical protein
VGFQHSRQTQVEAAELHPLLEVAVEPGLTLAADPAVAHSIGSRQHSLHSLRMLHRGLHQAGWHSTGRIERCNRSATRLHQVVQVWWVLQSREIRSYCYDLRSSYLWRLDHRCRNLCYHRKDLFLCTSPVHRMNDDLHSVRSHRCMIPSSVAAGWP